VSSPHSRGARPNAAQSLANSKTLETCTPWRLIARLTYHKEILVLLVELQTREIQKLPANVLKLDPLIKIQSNLTCEGEASMAAKRMLTH
jgi:hypothetical protein